MHHKFETVCRIVTPREKLTDGLDMTGGTKSESREEDYIIMFKPEDASWNIRSALFSLLGCRGRGRGSFWDKIFSEIKLCFQTELERILVLIY